MMDTKKILENFQCPVCYEYMHPPIKMCVLKHNFCENCDAKVQICPICRSEKSNARNLEMESLHDTLTFPCRNEFTGCSFESIGTGIVNHIKYCVYEHTPCSFKSLNLCKWSGRKIDIVKHWKEEHPNHLFCTNQVKLNLCPHHKVFIYYVIFHVYNELFIYMCELDVASSCVYSWVHFLGPEEDAKKYNFYCKFSDGIYNRVPWESSDYIFLFQEERAVTCDLEELDETYGKTNFSLSCTIFITKSDEAPPTVNLAKELPVVVLEPLDFSQLRL